MEKEKLIQMYTTYKTIVHSVLAVLGLLIILGIVLVFFTAAPRNVTLPITFTIKEGASLKEVTSRLKEDRIIRSRSIANMYVVLTAGDGGVVSGEYAFDERQGLFKVMHRITTGDFGFDIKQVRIPEGATVEDIGFIFESIFEDFSREEFMTLAEGKEGYLFPDTYQFAENVDAKKVIKTLENTFDTRIKPLRDTIRKSPYSLENIIIMASIIEKEADATSRQEVGDILWKRIEEGMRLQVDATFVYSIDKGTFDLSLDDLRDDSNPYNTYTHEGLPPTPIGNPGIKAIEAAAHPQPTDYFYFLTGRDGNMYYAETFEGHKENRRLYLD